MKMNGVITKLPFFLSSIAMNLLLCSCTGILQISFLMRSGTSLLLMRSLKANRMQVKGQGETKMQTNMPIRAEAHVCVCVGKRERERDRERATGLLSDVFLMAEEMFWNLKRFRGITGTPLSILDNYSVRPTSEGQITSVWGKKRNQSVFKTETDA